MEDTENSAKIEGQPEPNQTENQEASPETVDIEALKAELEKERSMATQYLTNWQRAQADFINYRRRVDQEKSDLQKYGSAMLILRLLAILDDMERAFATVPNELGGFTWFQGMGLIYRKFVVELEAQGLAEVIAQDQDFDPNQHEAVLFGEGEEGKVVSVLQKGYTLHGKVIRPALVKVGQGVGETAEMPADETQNNTEE